MTLGYVKVRVMRWMSLGGSDEVERAGESGGMSGDGGTEGDRRVCGVGAHALELCYDV